MSVRIIPLSKLPKATRNKSTKIMLSPEWKDAVSKVQFLKKGNAMAVEFSPETLRLGKTTAQRFKRLFVRELTRMGMTELRAFFRGKDGRGQPILYIAKP